MTDRLHPPDPAWSGLPPAARAKALELALVRNGVVTTEAVDRVVAHYRDRVGPRAGARVVARAWTDRSYRDRLLTDADSALEEMGVQGFGVEHMVAVENGPTDHHVIVCTLCSCYPWPLLGLPPTWYKSPWYRAEVVRDPRRTLRAFGLELSEQIRVHVHDSTSEIRFLVVPERPAATGGWSAERLRHLVTRDSMVGVARALDPRGARS